MDGAEGTEMLSVDSRWTAVSVLVTATTNACLLSYQLPAALEPQ
jgi:hypothetical protein